MKNKIKFLIAGLLIGIGLVGFSVVNAQDSSLWKFTNSLLQPVVSSWNLYAPASFRFDGEIMPDGDTCSNGEILKKTGANNWDCASDATGAGGSTTIQVTDQTTSISPISTISFDPTYFDVVASGSVDASIRLLTGLSIPKTASITNWESFYDTPSGRITAGDQLSWSGNQLNVDDSFLFNTGDTATGLLIFSNGASVSGGTFEVSVPASISSLTLATPLDISGDTNLTAGDHITLTDDDLDVDDDFLFNTGDTATGLIVFSSGASVSSTGTFEVSGTASISQLFLKTPLADSYVADSITVDWTGLQTYPTGCTNQFVRTIGDTLTCNTVDISADTTFAVNLTGLELDGSDDLVLSTGYFIPLTASGTAWEAFRDTPSTRITDGTGLTWSANTLNVDDSYLLIAGDIATGLIDFQGGASVSLGTFEVSGTASISAFRLPKTTGGTLEDCDDTANTLGWDATTGKFVCNTDATGGGGGTTIEVQDGSSDIGNFSSISFEANMFRVTDTTGEALIKLDWDNGPASRSATQSITGAWTFTNASNQFSNTLEIKTASISTLSLQTDLGDSDIADNLTINGGTVTWTDLTTYPTGCTNQFVRTIGDTLTCNTVDISADTTFAVSATGLELDGNDDLVLTSGYSIFKTASGSNWETFYDTPSNRITDGTGLTWSGNTLNVDDAYLLNNGDTATGLTIFSAGASVSSGNLEVIGIASGSFFNGSAFSSVGDCNDNGEALGWDGGVFVCNTLTDADVPNTWEAVQIFSIGASSSTNFEVAQTASAQFFNGSAFASVGNCTGTANKLTWNGGLFDCENDETGGGSSFFLDVAEGDSIASYHQTTSISFDAGMFNVAYTASKSTVRLDWDSAGGPASLSQAETISGNWVNTANPWAVNEGGTGANTLTGLLQGNGTSAFTAITDSSTAGQVLRVTGASTYAWGALDLDDTDAITGTLGSTNIEDVYLFNSGDSATGKMFFTAGASVSAGNFEVIGISSASFFNGSAFSAVGDCNDAGESLLWDAGLFTCGTGHYQSGGTDVALGDGGTGASLVDPNDDRIFLWDDSAGATVLMDLGSKLTTTATPLLTIASNSLGFADFLASASLDKNHEFLASTFNFSINLDSTGDFRIEDNGAVFATFSDTGTFTLDNLSFDGSTFTTTTGDLTIDANSNNVIISANASVSNNFEVGGFASISNSGYFKLPWGTAPTIDANGKIGVDDSGRGQLVYYASGSEHTLSDELNWSFSIGSGSFNTWASRSIEYAYRGKTVKRITCKAFGGTSIQLRLSRNGTTDMDTITCATSETADDGSIANATIVKGDEVYLEKGTVSGEVDRVRFTVQLTGTRE